MSKEEVLKQQLNVDELDNVSGGKMEWDSKNNVWHSDCFCFGGGGGTADYYQNTCACVLGGAGELTEAGKTLYRGNLKADGIAMACASLGTK